MSTVPQEKIKDTKKIVTNVTSQIIEANQGFMDAFNSNDSKALGKVYTQNARLFPSNTTAIEGREAIENFWESIFKLGIAKAKLVTIDVEGFDETAIEEGNYTLYDANDNTVDEGKYIIIWKKVDAQWLYDKDIWNTSLPVPQ